MYSIQMKLDNAVVACKYQSYQG